MPINRKNTPEAAYCLTILCGGMSSRLGTDKGLFSPLGDEPLVVRMIRLLGTAPQQIQVVIRDTRQKKLYQAELSARLDAKTREKISFVSDEDALGATVTHASLLGVYAALKTSSATKHVVVPVDQVSINQRDIDRLVAQNRLSCFGNQDDIAPFPSLWQREHADALKTLMGAGSFSVKTALKELGATAISTEPMFMDRLNVNVNTKEDIAAFFGEALFDRYHRRLHYLRLSLTESCNMSCSYCLPDGFPEWYRHKARMQRPELETILKAFKRLGFRKVRFTGGEPTLHPHALDAVRYAKQLGYEEISLTTNGLLINNISPWIDAGLTSINISMDSLNPRTFAAMTRSSEHPRVLDLIESSAAAGLTTKVNTVLLRSQNGHEAADLIQWASERPITLRFIELMPTGLNQSFHNAERVSGEEIALVLASLGYALGQTASSVHMRGPATVYEHTAKPGKIGLINPLSCNFCDACNRLRITAQAKLRLCLFGKNEHPLDLSSPAALEMQMRALISKKEERHHLNDEDWGNVATFRTIGG